MQTVYIITIVYSGVQHNPSKPEAWSCWGGGIVHVHCHSSIHVVSKFQLLVLNIQIDLYGEE